MKNFKLYFLRESTADDVRALFAGVGDDNSPTYLQDLYAAVSRYADYLDTKGNSVKAELIRSYLENPEEIENRLLLSQMGESGKSGFASPYYTDKSFFKKDPSKSDGSTFGPFYSANLKIDNLLDFFEVPEETRRIIEQRLEGRDWSGAGYVSLHVPVRNEFAKQAHDAQMGIRQYMALYPEMRDKILDYDNMDVEVIIPAISAAPGAYHNMLPNLTNDVVPFKLSAHLINKLRPLVESEWKKTRKFNWKGVPPISNDHENISDVEWDLRRMGRGMLQQTGDVED